MLMDLYLSTCVALKQNLGGEKENQMSIDAPWIWTLNLLGSIFSGPRGMSVFCHLQDRQ